MVVRSHLNKQKQKDHSMRLVTSVYIMFGEISDVNL